MSPKIFYKKLSAITKIVINTPMEGRRCVITRSPGYFGDPYNCIIEWEGSPPKNVIFCDGSTPVWLCNKPIRANYRDKAKWLVQEFLATHPAKDDGSPVWIDSEE